MMQEETNNNSRKKRTLFITIIFIFLILFLLWFCYWFFYSRFSVTTKDAYIHGNQVMLKSQVAGSVKNIYPKETNFVTKGQTLVSLDTNTYELNYIQKQASLAETVRSVSQLFLTVEEMKANVEQKKASLFQAEIELFFRHDLVENGAISKEEYIQKETDVALTQANLTLSQAQFDKAKEAVFGTDVATHPLVLQSIQSMKHSYLQLIQCDILAPCDGYVAKRSVQVGDRITGDDTLMIIVPLDTIWLEANYKETQLKNIRVGQKAVFTTDMYGSDVHFDGTVVGFQPGTGNAFALLPVENASGNWIKIIQRLPIRIQIDKTYLNRYPLFIGLTCHVSINQRKIKGEMLNTTPPSKPSFFTLIYEEQAKRLATLDPLIQEIITKNSTHP